MHVRFDAANELSGTLLNQRIVFFVGAGGHSDGWGNGHACAVAYAAQGAIVVCVDNDEEALAITVRDIRSRGGSAEPVVLDATNEMEVNDAVIAVQATFGRIDVLHNNVRGSGTGRTLADISVSDWENVFRRNVLTAVLSCRAVAPIMLANGSGAIINVSSIASIRHMNVPSAVYSAAKAPLTEFTRNIAVQHAADGIRANCILPGYIDTPIRRRVIDGVPAYRRKGYDDDAAFVSARNATVPLGRMGTAWDVACAAIYLASDIAADVTGTTLLVVDGTVSSTCPGT